jgi:hypothetical protein
MKMLNNKKVVILAFAATALIAWRVYATTPKPPAPQIWTPGCVASVPRSWGQFRGASTQSGLAFEDSAGTLRFLTNMPCDGTPVVALEVRRTGGNTPTSGNQ